MSIFANSRFKRRFPGPYDIRPSRDGVDDTFDIYCLETNEYIAATRYWDERERAYAAAYAIATALNVYIHDLYLAEHRPLMQQFYTFFPGPYRLTHGRCRFSSYHSIECKTTGDDVITCYGGRFDFETLSIIHTIDDALTRQRMRLPFADDYCEKTVLLDESELILF